MTTLLGADYVPVLYVGKQVINGINYMIICKQTDAVSDALEHLVKIIINNAPTGEWALGSMKKIV